jgi:hypothetical protein
VRIESSDVAYIALIKGQVRRGAHTGDPRSGRASDSPGQGRPRRPEGLTACASGTNAHIALIAPRRHVAALDPGGHMAAKFELTRTDPAGSASV